MTHTGYLGNLLKIRRVKTISKNLYAIKRDGFYKHFPHGQYDAYLSKDCLFVKRETAENKCALNGSDEIVEVSLVEVEGEA